MYNQLKESEVEMLKSIHSNYIAAHGEDLIMKVIEGFDIFVDYTVKEMNVDRDQLIGSEGSLQYIFVGFLAGYETALFDLGVTEESDSTVH